MVPLGLQKRVELARALAAEPKLLILDEPMAGMNQEEKEYMARFILDVREARGVTVLMIEHHMDVVASLCDRMAVLNYGELIAAGTPKEALAQPRVDRGLSWKAACPCCMTCRNALPAWHPRTSRWRRVPMERR